MSITIPAEWGAWLAAVIVPALLIVLLEIWILIEVRRGRR